MSGCPNHALYDAGKCCGAPDMCSVTHPDPTPGKGNTPRVSDEQLRHCILQTPGWCSVSDIGDLLALDLLNARQSLAARDARIAELEAERDETRRKFVNACKEVSGWCSNAWEMRRLHNEQEARADRLAAEIAELRTAGTRAK